MSKAVQGPGFFIIIAGNSAADFEYKKRVLGANYQRNRGQSLKESKILRRKGFCCSSASESPLQSARHSAPAECLSPFLLWARGT